MRTLVEVAAAWTSKPLDIAKITSRLSIQRATVESYLNALEGLYLIERVPAWTKGDYARIGKQPKFFMSDSGLAASILGWRAQEVALDPDRSGKILETFAYCEIAAAAECGEDWRIHHYRDWENREIDLLLERERDGAMLAVEVKATSSVKREDFRTLQWFKQTLARDSDFTGVVVYTGERLLAFGEGLWAVPFASLWAR